jgi:polysaccharide deacetylase family protein (PEP-CTERM system associated)
MNDDRRPPLAPATVLSFDVEEHWRIEAAAGLSLDEERKTYYAGRVAEPTLWILDQLERHEQKATFFIVGQLAREQPDLVRAIQRGGHEIASHGWDHQRIHNFTPPQFHEDVRLSKDVLEQITGEPVLGYRAPTFSVVRRTAWALDVLVEHGLLYDSSVYPVRHDRYGVAEAPRGPFLAQGYRQAILELPPVRLDVLGLKVPAGGGGYFRLFPLFVLEQALAQSLRCVQPPIGMLYFHPWEFDPGQDRLPLGRVSRFRTYVGIRRSRPRLSALLGRHSFARAADVARQLQGQEALLPRFRVAEEPSRNQARQEIAGVA